MPANTGGNQQVNIESVGTMTGFPLTTGVATQAGYPASKPVQGATVPYWSYGTGVPTFVAPYGSLYTDVGVTAPGAKIFYCYRPTAQGSSVVGTWQAII